jgi:hypothetical protein
MTMEILFRRLDFTRMALSRLDRFTCRWKSPDESLVIGFSFSVGGSWRLGAADAIEDPKPYQHKETEDSIERAPPEKAHPFEHGVVDLPDDLGGCSLSTKNFSGLPRSPSGATFFEFCAAPLVKFIDPVRTTLRSMTIVLLWANLDASVDPDWHPGAG